MASLFFCFHRPCGNSRHPLSVQDIFYHHYACRDQATYTHTNAFDHACSNANMGPLSNAHISCQMRAGRHLYAIAEFAVMVD